MYLAFMFYDSLPLSMAINQNFAEPEGVIAVAHAGERRKKAFTFLRVKDVNR